MFQPNRAVRSKYYEDSVAALRRTFNRLTLTLPGEAVIRFADPEVLRVLNSSRVFNMDGTMADVNPDGDGLLTVRRASEVETLSIRQDKVNSVFYGNKLVETFNEFRYFTGLGIIGSNMFDGCSNLRELTLPVCKATKVNRYTVNNTKVYRFIVPEGYTEIDTIRTGEGEPFQLIDLPSTMRNIIGFLWNYGCDTLVCRAVTPPSVNWLRVTMLNKIYVPDAAVDDYRKASGWNSKASIIYPLSEYTNNI